MISASSLQSVCAVIPKGVPQLSEVKNHHALMVENGNLWQLFEANSLIDMYVKCRSMIDARYVFEKMPRRNAVSWNMMILACAKQEDSALALELYSQMHQEGVQPSDRTFVCALKACSSLAALEEGKQVDQKFMKLGCLEKGRAIYSQVLKSQLESNVFVGNTLVDMFTKCGCMEDAHHIFDQLPHRDVVTWTAMISGYANTEDSELAMECYAGMLQEGIVPDHRPFVGALKACSSLAVLEKGTNISGKCVKIEWLERGRAVHSQVVKSGFELDAFVGNTLVDMYSNCGNMEDARHVFDQAPYRNVVSWNAMISGCVNMEECALGLDFYSRMQQEGVLPDQRTLVSTLNACSNLAALEEGKQIDGRLLKIGCLGKGRAIHFEVLKNSFESDIFVGNSLLDMYVKCRSLEDARHVFDTAAYRNIISWNTMIFGYAEIEESEEAFKVYAQMQELGLSANSFTFVSILKACCNAAALATGREVHAQICLYGLDAIAIVATTLIDLYSKCGSMVDAQQLFDALPTRDFITWNALIGGYACQGESELVFFWYERMRQVGVEPNGVTFLSILTACSHAGLVEKAQAFFQAMIINYGIIPSMEHYNCMVDLLGRAGKLEEAVAMMDKMPFQPDIVAWLAVLGACQRWNNVQVGRHAFEHVVRLNEKYAAAYVLMSNIS